MIDFHTHILPCVDDGSQSIQESVSMLREEARQGISTVILTPHYYADECSPAQFLSRRQRAWNQLQQYLDPQLPEVFLGAEVQYFEGICAAEDIRDLRIEGTDYLLLEMPFSKWSERMVDTVLDLNDSPDMQIVLAHIERYLAMQPKRIWQQLWESGVMMQCNVSFFESWKTRHKAMRMLNRGQIHFIGSDCHNMKTRRPNWKLLPDKVRERLQRNTQTRFPEKAAENET